MDRENLSAFEMTGLEVAESQSDLIKTLIGLANYKDEEADITTIEIKRAGETKLKFKIHPLSEEDIERARRKATKYLPNPRGSKYPKIAGEMSASRYNNYLIYDATIPSDQKKIWGQKEVMQAIGALEPAESVGKILMSGESARVVDTILEISGYNNEVTDRQYYDDVKN